MPSSFSSATSISFSVLIYLHYTNEKLADIFEYILRSFELQIKSKAI